MVRWLAVLAVAILAASGVPAAAQQQEQTGTGQLRAQTSGAPLPFGAEVQVTPGESDDIYGNDPLYRAARVVVQQDLRARGFMVGDRPVLRLAYAVSTVGYATPSQSLPTHAGSSEGPAPRATVTDQFRLPFSAPAAGSPPSLTVTLMLYDADGNVLWTATIGATGHFPRPERTVALLTRTALDALGTSVERSFILGCKSSVSGHLCIE